MRALLSFTLIVTGCALNGPTYHASDDSDDSVDIDAAPDAETGCEPNTIVCDDANNHYVDCSADGTVEFEMDCPLGCDDVVEKCLDVDPSNGLAAFLDMAPSGPDVAFTGTSQVFSTSGIVFNAGASIDVPTELFDGMRIFWFRSLSISGTLTAEKDEGPSIVFLVDGDVLIDGGIDVSADGMVVGPGGLVDGTCVGHASITGGTVSGGGGGGGYADTGGSGGAPGNGGAAATGGANDSNDQIVPLRGGCNGGTVGEGTDIVFGGGGGGALQIVSRTKITLTGDGYIDASGGGGSTSSVTGGAGGGSGGGVLLEAPQVILDGPIEISTKGGGGAAATTSGAAAAGADGGITPGQAAGGTSASFPDGGSGGNRNVSPGAGQSGTSGTMDGAGGGGSVGRTRFNTSSGLINPQNGAAIYSNYVTAPLRTRLVPP